jgi:hypothetical protein
LKYVHPSDICFANDQDIVLCFGHLPRTWWNNCPFRGTKFPQWLRIQPNLNGLTNSNRQVTKKKGTRTHHGLLVGCASRHASTKPNTIGLCRLIPLSTFHFKRDFSFSVSRTAPLDPVKTEAEASFLGRMTSDLSLMQALLTAFAPAYRDNWLPPIQTTWLCKCTTTH